MVKTQFLREAGEAVIMAVLINSLNGLAGIGLDLLRRKLKLDNNPNDQNGNLNNGTV